MVSLSNTCRIAACVAIAVGLALAPRPAACQPKTDDTSQTSAPPSTPAQRPLLRIGTTLVEIDAVVTDKQGRHLTDLTPDDFELHQDGRKQKITSVRYVHASPAGQAAAVSAANTDHDSLEGATRIVAIVLDDLNMSFTSMAYTRRALLELIDTQIEPGDRVAVIRVGQEGMRTEWFTSDKRALRDKVSGLRYNVMSLSNPRNFDSTSSRIPVTSFDLEREAFTVGGLGAVNTVVKAMRAMPGRKAVVLATDGFPLLRQEGRDYMYSISPGVADAVKRLVDDANRSFVTLYTVDTRRLEPPDMASADSSLNLNTGTFKLKPDLNSDGPYLLADAGGGLYLRNSNDLAGLFTKVLDDQRGYYLLAYEPDDRTFDGKRQKRPTFHNVKVMVSRPDVRVRARAGFFGVTDDELRPPLGREEPATVKAP
jgi:VWFA-related protein